MPVSLYEWTWLCHSTGVIVRAHLWVLVLSACTQVGTHTHTVLKTVSVWLQLAHLESWIPGLDLHSTAQVSMFEWGETWGERLSVFEVEKSQRSEKDIELSHFVCQQPTSQRLSKSPAWSPCWKKQAVALEPGRLWRQHFFYHCQRSSLVCSTKPRKVSVWGKMEDGLGVPFLCFESGGKGLIVE